MQLNQEEKRRIEITTREAERNSKAQKGLRRDEARNYKFQTEKTNYKVFFLSSYTYTHIQAKHCCQDDEDEEDVSSSDDCSSRMNKQLRNMYFLSLSDVCIERRVSFLFYIYIYIHIYSQLKSKNEEEEERRERRENFGIENASIKRRNVSLGG